MPTLLHIVILLTAVATFGTAAIGLVRTARTGRTVADVHTIVNSERADTLAYQQTLIAALHDAGVAVPDPQRADRDIQRGSS